MERQNTEDRSVTFVYTQLKAKLIKKNMNVLLLTNAKQFLHNCEEPKIIFLIKATIFKYQKLNDSIYM